MRLACCIAALAGVATMGGAAQTAPTVDPRAPSVATLAHPVACWRRGGSRHCGYAYGPRYRVYGYPNYYRTGSGRWWHEMDREGRGGRR
jgi:hypothetical protein